jgi:hypothetical protein
VLYWCVLVAAAAAIALVVLAVAEHIDRAMPVRP